MSPLQKLKGMRIESIEPNLDYWQIVLSQACVSAYTKLELSHPAPELLGEEVIEAKFQEDIALEICLSNGRWFTISLRPEHLIGPEAFNVHFASGQIVVG